MMWKQVTVIKLLNEFRNQEVLWNPRNPKFYKNIEKVLAWKEISHKMDMPAGTVKTKMENLLSQFRRERKKITKNSKRGSVTTSTWYGYKHLKFLIRKKQRSNRLTNEDINGNSETQDQEMPETGNLSNKSTSKKQLKGEKIGSDAKSENTANRHKSSIDIKKSSFMTAVANAVKSALPPVDANQTFANYIASKMRTYSPNTKNAVNREIYSLLIRADCSVFNDDQYVAVRPARNLSEMISEIENCLFDNERLGIEI